MINKIDFETIQTIWREHLWPNRQSSIEPCSALCYLTGKYDLHNIKHAPTFFAYEVDGKIAGVNSGHKTVNGGYRSRGLFVFEEFRGQRIGSKLLAATIDQARLEHSFFIWSLPRKTAWTTYEQVGFTLDTDWRESETSDLNAYCHKFIYDIT